MDWMVLLAIFGALILIGFLSGIEIAFVSANKLSIELNKKQGTSSGKTWGKFSEKPTRFIGTVLLSFNVLLVIYGLLIGDILYPVWNWIEPRLHSSAADYLKYIRLFVETVLSTIIILFVEFTSKAIFRARNNNVMQSGIISYVAEFFYWLFSSASSFFVNASEWILKYIFNVKINEKKEVFNKIDLEHFFQQSKNHDEEESSDLNQELFENALSLSDIKVRECLIPRKEIVSVGSNKSIEDIKDIFIETKLSKIVVYDQSIDNITGYVHHLDMFKNPARLQDVLHPIPTVPESMSASDLMTKFSKERRSIAWVIDEFGGTAGIVTMEDLLEEIFGEIQDEYDEIEEFIDKQLASDEYIFSGRLELDYITEKYELAFPDNDNDAETLSGYIIHNNEAIPKLKDRIIVGNYVFDILNVSDTRIETVKIKVLR